MVSQRLTEVSRRTVPSQDGTRAYCPRLAAVNQIACMSHLMGKGKDERRTRLDKEGKGGQDVEGGPQRFTHAEHAYYVRAMLI